MKELSKLMQIQFLLMCQTGALFVTKVTGSQVWKKYLESFKEGDDLIFRDPQSSEHNCNNCNAFIKRYGNIVAVDKDGKLMSMFDLELPSSLQEYKNSMHEMNKMIIESEIQDVFFETYEELNSLPYGSCKKNDESFRLGLASNVKRWTEQDVNAHPNSPIKVNEISTFNHFHVDVPKQFVDVSGKSHGAIKGFYREKYNVFRRALEELNSDTLSLVIDLINQGSLFDGEASLSSVKDMLKYYKKLENASDNMLWKVTYDMPERIAKFKNTLIGVLCTELAEGMELNKACENWNKRVDPVNYKNATAPVTPAMMKVAQKEFASLGFNEKDLARRLVSMDDIHASEILHMNESEEKPVSIFDTKHATAPSRHKRSEFDKVESIPIEKFMKDILPSAKSVEVYVGNDHINNFVTMTTAKNQNSNNMFKWGNPFSWTYKGNLEGKSRIKDTVKSLGGDVSGVVRFSIMWSEGDSTDDSDLDAHCHINKAVSNKIYFGNSYCHRTDGKLDIDIMTPISHKKRTGKNVVENITFPSLDKIKGCDLLFKIHQYNARQSQGWKAEIEFDGQLYEYSSKTAIPNKRSVDIAKVSININGTISIDHIAESKSASKEVWGIETENFHKVNLICKSPNHWENEVGNKHYMFMLDGCKPETPIRGFHNDNLDPKLSKIRKVMNILGQTTMIKDTPPKNGVAGIGFNSTVRDEVVVKVSGSHKRMMKIVF